MIEDIKNPTGIKTILEDAKNAGHLWADTAIGELNLMTGRDFNFEKDEFSLKYKVVEIKSIAFSCNSFIVQYMN